MTSAAASERTRQAVHVAMGAFALLLRYLTWWQATLLAGAAVAFNCFVLPEIGGTRLYRTAEHTRGYSAGMLLYPLAVLLLLFAFPARLDIVAAAWGILAAGDGMATIVGTIVVARAPVESRQERRGIARAVPVRRRGGRAPGLVVPTGGDSRARFVVLAGRAVRCGGRRGSRGNDSHQAGRQPDRADDGRRRAVGRVVDAT